MKDQYVGDVGDFGKYGLLRVLCADSQLRLGVIWYLTPNDEVPKDGELRRYANLRNCDPSLHDALSQFDDFKRRSVATIRELGLLPETTAFFEEKLSFPAWHGPVSQLERRNLRDNWLAGALKITGSCDLIFADPDNGLETKSVSKHNKRAPKYVFLDDLRLILARGQGVIVYHHIGRDGDATQQAKFRRAQIIEELGVYPFVLKWSRGSARFYFIIPAGNHRSMLDSGVRQVLASPWGQHFTLFE